MSKQPRVELIPATEVLSYGRHVLSEMFGTDDENIYNLEMSIRTNGFDSNHPIKLDEGTDQVTDGWHRTVAAANCGIKVPVVRSPLDASETVMLENLTRRESGPGRRAAGVALCRPLDTSKERLAVAARCSASLMGQAIRLVKADRQIASKVSQGELSMEDGLVEAGLKKPRARRFALKLNDDQVGSLNAVASTVGGDVSAAGQLIFSAGVEALRDGARV